MGCDAPFAWVAADTVYGVGEVEQVLRRAGKGYVLGVASTHQVAPGARRNRLAARPRRWPRPAPRRIGSVVGQCRDQRAAPARLVLCGAGRPFGRRVGGKPDAIWTRGLLVRRHLGDGTLAFFSTWCPAGTPLATLVAVEGHRWSIEDSFETAKNELGLGSQRDKVMARLASSRLAGDPGLRYDGEHPPQS